MTAAIALQYSPQSHLALLASTTADWILVLSTFLACAVEAVEALTVILAVGVTRGWRAPITATITGRGATPRSSGSSRS